MILSQTSHFSDFTVHLRLTECNEVLELTGDYVNRLSSQFLLVLQWTFVGAFFLVFRQMLITLKDVKTSLIDKNRHFPFKVGFLLLGI